MPGIAAIVLAAGLGTRMNSALPKVLHPVCGVPMIKHVLRGLECLQNPKVVVVVGHQGEEVQRVLGTKYTYAFQPEQLGTGHAVIQAEETLAGFEGPVLVLYGDTPMLRPETVLRLVTEHEATGAVATVLKAAIESPEGYGRILRDDLGRL
ncbi:MAG: NTP transferase domain-containing protein, partial [Limnochordia bacterium]|nr:NTP transferase domain-containing protein [Limnochordia bacterium]